MKYQKICVRCSQPGHRSHACTQPNPALQDRVHVFKAHDFGARGMVAGLGGDFIGGKLVMADGVLVDHLTLEHVRALDQAVSVLK